MTENCDSPIVERRVILLGASNLTLGFPLVLKTLQHSLTGPTEVFTAHGHGRSFCQWSYVLYRGLPSIPECGLWEALNARPPAKQTWAMVTDLGNDLIYGRDVEQVHQNVQRTLERLRSLGAEITFVRPPLERIQQLTERRYRIVKQLLFPGPTVPWKEIYRRIIDLDAEVTSTAKSLNASIVTPQLHWYGLDPIHIARSKRLDAWREILNSWRFQEPVQMVRPGNSDLLRIWNLRPAERTIWKRPQRTPQPVWTSSDGWRLWQY